MPKPQALTPQDHQSFAIETLLDNESLLVEYGTGTGKTLIYVMTCDILVAAGDTPVLIVTRNSLLEQTEEEFRTWLGDKWTDRHVLVLDRNRDIYHRREALKRSNASVLIISTESLSYPMVREGIKYRNWAAAIVDEASTFRNYSKRTITLKALGRQARTRYAFTGNLTVRTPGDCWYVTNFLKPGCWGTNDRNIWMHDNFIMGGYMGNIPIDLRPDRYERFQQVLGSMRIQCDLSDIRDLPPRVMVIRKVEIADRQKKAYIQMRDELKVEIESTTNAEFRSEARTYATRLQRLQEICSGFARNIEGEVEYLPSPKTEEMLAILDESPDPPTIIWYWWKPEREIILAALKKKRIPYAWFGEKGAVKRFMSGEVNVFVSQLAKGGYGLNLTRATRMIYHSLPWDLDAYLQSQERNMRLTTTASHLEVIHLISHGVTADDYVRKSLLGKADMSRRFSRSQALELLR